MQLVTKSRARLSYAALAWY